MCPPSSLVDCPCLSTVLSGRRPRSSATRTHPRVLTRGRGRRNHRRRYRRRRLAGRVAQRSPPSCQRVLMTAADRVPRVPRVSWVTVGPILALVFLAATWGRKPAAPVVVLVALVLAAAVLA